MPPRTPAPDAGPGSTLFPPWMEAAKPAAAPVDVGAKDQRHPQRARRPPELETESTCVEPDYLALLRSVSSVLYRRIRDNDGPQNITHPLFCEDTHTEVPAEDRYRVVRPPLLPQSLPMPTMYMLRKLPPPTKPPTADPPPRKRKLKIHRAEGGGFKANRSGNKLCRGFQRGECADERRCAEHAMHQCEKCLSRDHEAYHSHECTKTPPQMSPRIARQVARSGGSKGAGKGRKGKYCQMASAASA